MRTPTAIVTQPLDLMKTISREQLSDSRDMGFVHFLKKTNNCKLIIIIAKSVIDKYFFFCEHFLTPFKTLPVTQLRSRERGKLHFRDSNFTNVPGGHAPGPPQEFVPPALNVRANGANGARPPTEPLHPVLPNATENPGSWVLYCFEMPPKSTL